MAPLQPFSAALGTLAPLEPYSSGTFKTTVLYSLPANACRLGRCICLALVRRGSMICNQERSRQWSYRLLQPLFLSYDPPVLLRLHNSTSHIGRRSCACPRPSRSDHYNEYQIQKSTHKNDSRSCLKLWGSPRSALMYLRGQEKTWSHNL